MQFVKLILILYNRWKASQESINLLFNIYNVCILISEADNRVLVIRLSSLGDILLTTPVIRALKSTYPSLTIDYLVSREYKTVIEYNPNISGIYEYDKSGSNNELINELKSNKYDKVIDLHNNLRSRIVSFKLGVSSLRYKKPSLKKYMLVNFKWNMLDADVSIPERYAESVPGLELDDLGAEFYLPGDEPIIPDNRLIGFCPGSKHFTKMWPADYYAELGNMFVAAGYRVVLIGGRDDMQICSKLEKQIKGSINKCNDNELFRTANEIKRCRIVVCNDSGLMHLAAAVRIPVTVLFGSTVKEFGFFPYKSKSLVLENDSLQCRPCTHIGRSNCPEQHFECMKEITPQVVYNNINNYFFNDD